MREAVFSSIVSWFGTGDKAADEALSGVTMLDLFAGSGAVAIEAVSRGAGPVRLVERDARVAALARRNADHVGASVLVTTSTVASVLAGRADRAYDIVWFDPPYVLDNDEVMAGVADVLSNGWLAEDGLLVLERSSRTADPDLPPELADAWTRRYGETTIHYATRENAQ